MRVKSNHPYTHIKTYYIPYCSNPEKIGVALKENGKIDLDATLEDISKNCKHSKGYKRKNNIAENCIKNCKEPCKKRKLIKDAYKNLMARKNTVIGDEVYGKPFHYDKLKQALFDRTCKTISTLGRRAEKRGFACTLDKEWLYKKIKNGKCEATGIPFEDRKPLRPTFDRINNKLGYTKENTWLVCWMYNRAKGEDTVEELRRLAKAICENNKQCVRDFKERTGVKDVG